MRLPASPPQLRHRPRSLPSLRTFNKDYYTPHILCFRYIELELLGAHFIRLLFL